MPEIVERGISPARLLALWTGALGPPIIWLIQFELNYALVPWACVNGAAWLLHLITLVALVLAAGCGLLAWTARNGHGPGYARFMGIGGAGSSAVFLLVILGQGIMSLILGPCQ